MMKTGIIGAGKVGTSLGRYFMFGGLSISGFFDADKQSAQDAAAFTNSESMELDELVTMSDALFLTVPDGRITSVWDQIKDLPLAGKFICHCSGALSAGEAFPGITDKGAFGYSIHPLFAVSDKFHSWKELTHAYFTIEGDSEHLEEISDLFRSLGNQVRHIKAEDKVKYHCAAAICSNQVIALIQQGLSIMCECGFDEDSALKALAPIITGNVAHIVKDGTVASLTGPVERCDTGTVKKHLACLTEKDRLLYKLLSEKLVDLGKRKNPERDYEELTALLSGNVPCI